MDNKVEKSNEEREYVVCDFTIIGGGLGGVYYKGNNIGKIQPTIIELAAVKVAGGKIVDKYNTFVGISDYDPWLLDFDQAPEFRGVTPMTLLGAPSLESALKRLRDFVKDNTLILREGNFQYEPFETLNKCGESFGIKFDNPVLRIGDILQAAEVLRECFNIGESDVLKIAKKMRGACDWKEIFAEYRVPFGRDDCLGYALAFAELVIALDMTIDVFT